MSFYAEWVGLREEPERLDEDFVQRLWFEQLYQGEMKTLTGEKIKIVQPGFWNHGAGPDFLRAALINGQGQRETGAVEIHCHGTDWKQHGHETDPHYDDVILHVVWKTGPKHFFASDSRKRAVRTLEFSSHLKFPFQELRRHYTSSELEIRVGARLGRCRRELDQLDTGEVKKLLEEAGWFRFQKRARLWSLRVEAQGPDQALWLGLADALGYSRNRESFGSLAQRLPITFLQKQKDPVRREALLFGLAGFLPERTLPKGEKAAASFRALWDEWWQLRSEWEEQGLPGKAWSMRGVRPLNRPERRLAVLSLLSDKNSWEQFKSVVNTADYPGLWNLFKNLKHPFWDRHCTLASETAKPRQLVGPDRCLRFWFNVAGPLAFSSGREGLREQLGKMRTGESMHHASVAAARLLGGRGLGPAVRSLLVKEGLLQVYQDFCLNDFNQCGDCDFPELVGKWRGKD